jgi:YD repeat-containing protein
VLGASFDANGNTTTLTPPGKPAHAFSYTPVDLEAQYTPPALAGINDPSSRFAYNRDKDLTGVSLPDGSSLALAYEAGSGRLLSVTPSAGAGNAVRYGYAAGTSQLSSVSNADGSLNITYDGPLAKQETMIGSVPGSISRVFDADFRVTQQTVNGMATSYAYDGDSLLIQAGGLTLVRDGATGLLSSTSLGAVSTTQAYNTFGELQSFGATFNGDSLYSYTLSYDRAGRISGKTETLGGVPTQLAYGYDSAGRLATVSRNGTQTSSYNYDANGNRTTLNGAVVASYDAQDRLLNDSGARPTSSPPTAP